MNTLRGKFEQYEKKRNELTGRRSNSKSSQVSQGNSSYSFENFIGRMWAEDVFPENFDSAVRARLGLSLKGEEGWEEKWDRKRESLK